jgi:hypothetical protein
MTSLHEEEKVYSADIRLVLESVIKNSQKQERSHLYYEFFDDYSYRNSSYAGLIIHPGDEFNNLAYECYFMENGPINLNHMLTYKASDPCKEFLHHGSGQKYTQHKDFPEQVEFITKEKNDRYYRAKLDCKKLRKHLKESEHTFRQIDSTFFDTHKEISSEEVPEWFKKTSEYIYKQIGKKPGYIMRKGPISLLNSSNDSYYLNKNNEWKGIKQKLQRKSYDIDIYLENTFISEPLSKITNLDMSGKNNKVENSTLCVQIYHNIQEDTYLCNIEDIGEFYDINIKTGEIYYNDPIIDIHLNNLKKCCEIEMYFINEDYLNECLKNFESDAESEYGLWIELNGKLVSDIPQRILNESKNNKCKYPLNISQNKITKWKGKNSSKFRVLFNTNHCDPEEVEQWIISDSIKAKTVLQTTFKPLINYCIKLYNHKKYTHAQEAPKKLEPGRNYIILFQNSFNKEQPLLLKYGLINDEKNLAKRLKQHKKSMKKYLKEFNFTDDNNYDDWECIEAWNSCPTYNPEGVEKDITNIFELYRDKEHNGKKCIEIFQNNQCNNKRREFVIINDREHFLNKILLKLNEINHKILSANLL